MIEKDLDKVLNYMKQYVENVYEHDSEPMLNWKDLKLVLEEIERLNNIINELEKWLKYKKEQMEEFELYKRKETGAFWYSTMGNIETFIERIQELKGSDSNE